MSSRRASTRAASGLVAAGVALLLSSAPVAAQDPPNSDFDVEFLDLLVVDANGNALDAGGGLTPFSLVLEGDAQCPGDSSHDDYRVDTYLVPLDADPTRLDFNGAGPNPPAFRTYDGFQMPLITTTGTNFAADLTGDAFEADGPGPIRDLPGFDFHSYVPTPGIDDWDGGVPPGSYRLGLACTFAGRMTNAWETTVEVTADSTDTPVGMRWAVTGPQPRELETATGSPKALVLGLVGFAVVAAVAAFLLNRSSKQPAEPTPAAEVEEPVP